nr:MAG: hypothetical protein [Bacteriophage sp.]
MQEIGSAYDVEKLADLIEGKN